MRDLPQGWEMLRLGDVSARTSNVDPSRTPAEEFELYSVPSFSEKRPEIALGAEIKSAKQAVQPDDVLLCKIVPHLNRVWVVGARSDKRQIASGEWIVYRDHGCDPDYLRQCLTEQSFRDRFMQTVAGVGGSLMRARPSEVAEIEVPLAPLPEQRRIVTKIDSLTGKSGRARDHLDHIPRLVEKYKQAVLAAAFRGDLTREWRLASGVADTWHSTSLSKLIAEGPTNGWSPKSGSDATGALSLKLTATTSGVLRLDDAAVKRIYDTPPPSSKFWLEKGDILVQRSNTIEYVGATAIFDGPSKTYIYPDLMMRIRVPDDTLRQYIWRFLNSEAARTYIRQNATGTAGNMPKISGATLKALPVELPQSSEEQGEIVRRIRSAFTWIDRLASEATSARRLVDRLDQAVLAKAFRGELVPQDPADEPASMLLERIRAERGAAPKARRGRKAKAAA